MLDTYEIIYIDNYNEIAIGSEGRASTSEELPLNMVESHRFKLINSTYIVKKNPSHKQREGNFGHPIYCLKCSPIYASEEYHIFLGNELVAKEEFEKSRCFGEFAYVEFLEISSDILY